MSSKGSAQLPHWIQRLVDVANVGKRTFIDAPVVKYSTYASITHWGWSEYVKRDGTHSTDRSNMHKLDSTKGDNIGDGYLSEMSCKKIRKAINFMIYSTRFRTLTNQEKNLSYDFKINLITLTLPSVQVHSDSFIKRECLEAFLSYCKRHYGMCCYVWKAESQDNENIHFHVTTNVYIPHDVIRQVWNRIVEKFGYIEPYCNEKKEQFKNGFVLDKNSRCLNKKTGKWAPTPLNQQMNRWKQGELSGWRNPNSTDVHAVQKVSKLASYLSGYIAKKDHLKKSAPKDLVKEYESRISKKQSLSDLKESYPEHFKRPIEGQIWNSSMNLKKASISIKVTEEIRVSLSRMASDIAKVSFRDSFVVCYSFLSGALTEATDDILEL